MAPSSSADTADRLEILELLHRYAAAVDDRDWDAYRAVFTPDARLDFTSAGGPVGTPDELIAWLTDALAPWEMSQHLVTNAIVSVDGDEATSRAYLYNPMRAADGAMMFVGGSYTDRLRRQADGWRFVERTFHMAWMHDGAPRR